MVTNPGALQNRKIPAKLYPELAAVSGGSAVKLTLPRESVTLLTTRD